MSRHATTHAYTRTGTKPRMRTCYVIRHAVAEERGDAWPNDDLRPLSRHGIKRMRRAVQGLAEIGVEVDLVLTSPLVRAVQTAKILADGLPSHPRVIEVPVLAPGHAPQALPPAVKPYSRARAIALVGHEPDLGALAAWLIGATAPIPFRKGAVCRIDFASWPPDPPGTLVWFATPKMLRGL